jgi:hypothetical protein
LGYSQFPKNLPWFASLGYLLKTSAGGFLIFYFLLVYNSDR